MFFLFFSFFFFSFLVCGCWWFWVGYFSTLSGIYGYNKETQGSHWLDISLVLRFLGLLSTFQSLHILVYVTIRVF